MRLLHIDASILGANSASRQLSAAVVGNLRELRPDLQVTYRDLAANPLPHLSGAHLAAARGATPQSPELRRELTTSQSVLEEFLAADVIVIGAPMYNFTIPSQLKAWIDRIVVAGKTFRYGAAGPEGLVGDKRVIIAIARGGFYGEGAPAAVLEHLESYLRGVFGFIGVNAPEFIIAEGLQVGPEQREKSMREAMRAAAAIAAPAPAASTLAPRARRALHA
jgi:FMN-dependent NADH-azoreductase